MLKLFCLCGRVQVETSKRPDFINECNCPLCGKSGAHLGLTTHWTLTESAVAKFGNCMMGVNMRSVSERDFTVVGSRYLDGQAWSGKGEVGYVRAARALGEAMSLQRWIWSMPRHPAAAIVWERPGSFCNRDGPTVRQVSQPFGCDPNGSS